MDRATPQSRGAGEAKPLGEVGVGCSTFRPLMSLEGAPGDCWKLYSLRLVTKVGKLKQ